MENENTTSTLEVDSVGGWLITHWTKTWDTRVPLTQLADLKAAAIQAVTDAQAKLTEIEANEATFKTEIATAQAAQAKAETVVRIAQYDDQGRLIN